LYYAFLQGGAFGIGLNKNELCLCKANQFRDLIQIIIAIAKYTSSFGLSIRISHLEGEEMFGSTKCKANPPPGLKLDSHRHDRMNFFHPKVANAIAPINYCQLLMWERLATLILLSPTMVQKSLNASVGMTFGGLNIVP